MKESDVNPVSIRQHTSAYVCQYIMSVALRACESHSRACRVMGMGRSIYMFCIYIMYIYFEYVYFVCGAARLVHLHYIDMYAYMHTYIIYIFIYLCVYIYQAGSSTGRQLHLYTGIYYHIYIFMCIYIYQASSSTEVEGAEKAAGGKHLGEAVC